VSPRGRKCFILMFSNNQTSNGELDTDTLSSLLASLQPQQAALEPSSTDLRPPSEKPSSFKPNLRVDVTNSPQGLSQPMDGVVILEQQINRYPQPAISPQGTIQSASSLSTTPKGGSPKENHQSTNIFVAGVPSLWDDKKLKERFQEFGEIVSVRMVPNRHFGFVMFKTHAAAMAAIAGAHQSRPTPTCSAFMHVTLSMHDEGVDDAPNERLFIRGLPEWATQVHLRNAFSTFGTIVDVSLLLNNAGHCKGAGFVQFSSTEEATAAMNGCHSARIENFDFDLEIKYSESPEVHLQRQERNRERYRTAIKSNNNTPTGSNMPSVDVGVGPVHGKAAFTATTVAMRQPPPPPPPKLPPCYGPQAQSPGGFVMQQQWSNPPVVSVAGAPLPSPQQMTVYHSNTQSPTHHQHQQLGPQMFSNQQQSGASYTFATQQPQMGTFPTQQTQQYLPVQSQPQHFAPPPSNYQAHHHPIQPTYMSMSPQGTPHGQHPSYILSNTHHGYASTAGPAPTISPKHAAPPTMMCLPFPTAGDIYISSPICNEDIIRQVLQAKCGITPDRIAVLDPRRCSYAVRLPDRNLHVAVAQSLNNSVFNTGHTLEVALFS
jgi:RNA recognition motif-containing protein